MKMTNGTKIWLVLTAAGLAYFTGGFIDAFFDFHISFWILFAAWAVFLWLDVPKVLKKAQTEDELLALYSIESRKKRKELGRSLTAEEAEVLEREVRARLHTRM